MAVQIDAGQKLTQEIHKAGSKNQSDLQLKLAKNPVQGIVEALQKNLPNSAIKFALEGNLSLKKSAKNPQIIAQIFSSLFQSDKPIIQSLFSDLLKDMKSIKHIGILFSSEAESRAVKPIIANVIKNLSPEKRDGLLTFLVGQGVIFEVDKIELNKEIEINTNNKKEVKNSKEFVSQESKKIEDGKAFHPGFSISFAQTSAIKETLKGQQNEKLEEDPNSTILSKMIAQVPLLILNSEKFGAYPMAKISNKYADFLLKESVG